MATNADPVAPPARFRPSAALYGALAFGAVVAGAFPLYLIRGNEQWFFLDEWDFLAHRRATSFHDLFAPHNEHWSTVPILVYRLLWQIVGLRSYVPYQVLIVALHLSAATLLFIVMRRARVQPFIAAAAGALFVLFGSGRQDIVWAFQIGFVGSLVCGLAHLLLADHDGPLNRNDAIGLAFGVVGLMCSGVAVTMTIIVGLAVLLRRGWRAAAFHAVPLAGLYGLWWLSFGRDASSTTSHSPGLIIRFVAVGLRYSFAKMGQVPGAGVALAATLVIGLVLACVGTPVGELRRRLSAPVALLAGGVAFLAISGVGRVAVFGPEAARASRYAHLFAAMSLPAVAVAADAVTRRWRLFLPIAVALFLIGIPGNIGAIRPHGPDRFTLGDAQKVEAFAHSPFIQRIPRSAEPLGVAGPDATAGWLRDGAASGRIPAPEPMTPAQDGAITLQLALRQLRGAPPGGACTTLTGPQIEVLDAGASFFFATGTIRVQLVTESGVVSDALRFTPGPGGQIQALAGPLRLRVSAIATGGRAALCT